MKRTRVAITSTVCILLLISATIAFTRECRTFRHSDKDNWKTFDSVEDLGSRELPFVFSFPPEFTIVRQELNVPHEGRSGEPWFLLELTSADGGTFYVSNQPVGLPTDASTGIPTSRIRTSTGELFERTVNRTTDLDAPYRILATLAADYNSGYWLWLIAESRSDELLRDVYVIDNILSTFRFGKQGISQQLTSCLLPAQNLYEDLKQLAVREVSAGSL